MNLQSICTRLNQYLIDSEDLYWKNWVGLQDKIDIASLGRKTGDLFSIKTIDFIRKLLFSETDPVEKNRLRSILGQITLSYMENMSVDIKQQILNKEAVTTVDWNGKAVALRSFAVQIVNEPDKNKRRDMINLREKTVEKEINPLRMKLLSQMFSSVKDMGYNNYIDLCQETQNRDFREFAKEMESFLSDTEEIYRKYLSYFLELATGNTLNSDTYVSDLTAIMRCKLFDKMFPSKNLLPVLKKTVGGMGFSLDKIHLDLDDRPSKISRPCVSAVNPPEDVRLTIYPMGGFDDYSGLLHETGHALHFIHEIPDLNFIHKFWGDRGFTEGTAYLFQNITLNSTWLNEIMGLTDIESLQKYSAFMGILRFRRLIGQFLYLMDLFETEDPESVKDRYLFHSQRAHQVKFNASDYLKFDMELYSAGYIRARMFEVQLRDNMIQRFGQTWWNSLETGEYLKTLFKHGRMNRADDVVVELGYKKLDSDYYKQHYLGNLV